MKPKVRARLTSLTNARRLDQKYEWAGAAVHDRHFGGTHVHIGIINAQPRKRG